MPTSDNIIVGQPIVDEAANFGAEEFRDDFSTLDIGTSADIGSTDGKWKEGLYSHHISQYGMDYGERGVINFERQIYSSPDRPDPSGGSAFSIVNGNLRVTSALVDHNNATHSAWARNKTYDLKADGTPAQLSDFGGSPPSDYGSYNEEEWGDGTKPLFFDNYPMKYRSGMLTTYGRFAMGMGRFEARCTMPYGADGASDDITQRSAIFPAPFWLLQDIPYGCGVNGEPTADPATTTYTPFTNSGQLTEIDVAEAFGDTTYDVHHTVHYHAHGDKAQIDATINTGTDTNTTFNTYTVDITPEKIGFAVNGIYTQVIATPVEIANPLSIYETVDGEEYNVVKDSSGHGVRIGTQKNDDGSDRYMKFAILLNLARDGKYVRDRARDNANAGIAMPAHTDDATMDIDYIRAAPLLDTPDTGGGDTDTGDTGVPGEIGSTYLSGGTLYRIEEIRPDGGFISILA